MISVRIGLALIVFVAATAYLVETLLATPVVKIQVLLALLGYVLAYFLWPSRRSGQRRDSNVVLDVLEIIVELPVEVFLWLLRLLGRLFTRDGGVDIDF